MAALSKDRATSYREGVEVDYPVAAGVRIFAGSLVGVDADGYAAPAADTSGYRFAGVATQQADNTTGADGAAVVSVRRVGVFEFDAASITQAMVGDAMYAVDDHSFDDTAGLTNHLKVGVLVKYVSATKGWIDIAR